MKIAIIADDLTGANDTGVQLAKQGILTSVYFTADDSMKIDQAAAVFDTDSRSAAPIDARGRVKKLCQTIKKYQPEWVYKKMDSTMRGNIGAELDAVYDALQPDFIVIAPAFPQNGRIVRDGTMYVGGLPLHETEVSMDPKTPVTKSYLPDLLRKQTDRGITYIPPVFLHSGDNELQGLLEHALREKTPYLLLDAESDEELEGIMTIFTKTKFHVIWAGSAGLANALAKTVQMEKQHVPQVQSVQAGLVMIVVGSVNHITRRQLQKVLNDPQTVGIELQSEQILRTDQEEKECARIRAEARKAVSSGKAIVLYSSGSPEEMEKTIRIGQTLGLNKNEVSDKICAVLGRLAAGIIEQYQITHLILTGGDTARQVCTNLGAARLQLIDEVESGVPIGILSANMEYTVITKAGGFGRDDILCRSLDKLRGGVK